jgi:hypothetical protein
MSCRATPRRLDEYWVNTLGKRQEMQEALKAAALTAKLGGEFPCNLR